MRFLRSLFISALFATSVGLLPLNVAAWEDGCLAVLQSDLKRQDLAAAIGLTYFKERPPGITRQVTPRKVKRTVTNKKGLSTEKEVTEFDIRYFDPAGKPIRDRATLDRIAALTIPPGYRDVWISPDTRSHVLSIGYDVKGRPQYAYHPLWTEATSVTKFIRMGQFGKQIANVRRVTLADLRSVGLNRRKLLAAAATILETGNIRVGSEKYMIDNGSYGLTTLLHEHVGVDGPVISFDFIGKEGIRHRFAIENPEVAPVIAELLARPGPRLFEYLDEAVTARTIDGGDVKKYLEEISGGEKFTAKDFRTWQGTTAAAKKLIELGPPLDAIDAEAKVKLAVEYAASNLRNKPGTARENYIFPLVLKAYVEGENFQSIVSWLGKTSDASGLAPEERFVLELLRRSTP